MNPAAPTGHTGHVQTSSAALPTAHGPWARLSRLITQEIRPLCGRDDVQVTICPGAGQGSPGCTHLDSGQVEIDGDLLEVRASSAHPHKIRDRARYPIAWGVVVHEAAHAAHSRVLTGPQAYVAAATLLEESRVEARQLQRRRRDRRWLRASARSLILDDVEDDLSWWSAATTAALILGRTDARVFTNRETSTLRRACDQVLGRKRVTALRRVWRKAHALGDEDTDGLLELGREWCRLVGVPPDGPAPRPSGRTAHGPGTVSPVAGAAASVLAAISPSPPTHPPSLPAPPTRPSSTAPPTVGTAGGGGTTPWTTRAPTDGERRAARSLRHTLRSSARREPHLTRTAAATPPGRLQVRAAVTAAAARAAGSPQPGRPWRRTRRTMPPEPRLRVGICCDVSGSMLEFLGPAASAAWITAQAAHTVGSCATVTFGQRATLILPPGHPPGQVREFEQEMASDHLPAALDILDQQLELTDPQAARLLVIISDGEVPNRDRRAAARQIDRLRDSGCLVVWISPGPLSRPLPGTREITLNDPATVPQTVQHAARRVLNDWTP